MATPIADWRSGLAGPALTIAQSAANPLRVMAGPGTGKSFALKRRIARLLAEGHAPGRILVVTFTRTAAAELKQELHALGVAGCDQIRAETLHSFCFRMLGQAHVFNHLARHARPIVSFNKMGSMQFEGSPMLEDIGLLGDFGDKRSRAKMVRAYEAAWARLQRDEPGWTQAALDAQFEEALLGWLLFHNSILIGELIPLALNFLRANATAPELTAFDTVIVDEYQDLNRAEQTLLDHVAEAGDLAIVGDEDQSIYSFRHAHPEGIVEFSTRHPSTADQPLAECRRCPKRVVALADYLIRRNHTAQAGTPRLNPYPTNPEGTVNLVQWVSPEEEARGIAKYARHLVDTNYCTPGDILILCPRRLLGYQIRDAFLAEGIPTHSFYHEEALEDEAAQEAFCLLTLLAKPGDRTALRYWLGFGHARWRAKEYALLRQHCEESAEDPNLALGMISLGALDLGKTPGIKARYELLTARVAALNALSGQALVDTLFPEDQPWASVLREATAFALEAEPNATPADLHEYIAERITRPEIPEAGAFARVMSLHKSKGLTSKVVIVSSCIEGLAPTLDSDDTPAVAARRLQESRRLFYVAVTRTKDILVLSSFANIDKLAYRIGARARPSGRPGHFATVASQFLTQLGPTTPATVTGRAWLTTLGIPL